MFKRKALVSAIIAVNVSQFTYAQRLEEMVVTATKRAQNMQDVPLAVQALDASSLDALNINNFDDFARYSPNLTLGSRGPGQATMYIRGMAIEPIAVMLSGAQGTTPNVALYLDEQPVTAPGRNLDVYAADLERVEILAGPQGSLFGASAQAGTVRLITQKPQLGEFDSYIKSSVSTTNNGEPSVGIEGMVNVPVGENAALRAVLYNIRRGGYIDNVAGEFTTDPRVNSESALSLDSLGTDATFQSATNESLVKENFNDSYYEGYRLSGRMDFGDDWNALLQLSGQELGSDGVFDYDPEVGELEVNRYFPDKLEDEFTQVAWTLEGRLGALDLLYTGAFLDREVQQMIDYTGYNNSGAFIAYYTCTYTNPAYITNYGLDPSLITAERQCLDPTKGFVGIQEHERQTHEFRFTTPQDSPWRLTAGVYLDDFTIKTQDNYVYAAASDLGFAPNAPISTARNINNNTRAVGVTFFNDVTRIEEQFAVFGEFSYDVSHALTATIGARYYELESDFYGSSNFADGIFNSSTNTDRGRDYDVSGGHTDEPLKTDDLIPKFNLTYKYSDDVLFYGTYSEGYRPGGFNRGGGIASANPTFPDVEVTYGSDDVINTEFGWKSMLMDGTFRLNGNIYLIEWTDMQVTRFDPVNVSILTFVENAADSEILGLELDGTWLATQHLTMFGALSYNDTEITKVKGQAVEITPEGSELPLTPKLQFNLRARYEWSLGNYETFWQFGVQYAGKSYSSIVAQERQVQKSYSTADAAIGFEKSAWRADVSIENLTDKRAQLFINNQDDIVRTTVNRPRTVSFRIRYSWK